MYKEYDVVVLTEHLPKDRIPAGCKGTVLLVLDAEMEIYEVEFINNELKSLGTYTVEGAKLTYIGT